MEKLLLKLLKEMVETDLILILMVLFAICILSYGIITNTIKAKKLGKLIVKSKVKPNKFHILIVVVIGMSIGFIIEIQPKTEILYLSIFLTIILVALIFIKASMSLKLFEHGLIIYNNVVAWYSVYDYSIKDNNKDDLIQLKLRIVFDHDSHPYEEIHTFNFVHEEMNSVKNILDNENIEEIR